MRGVFAKRDFKKGETLLYVPAKMCITLDHILNKTDIGQEMVQKNLTKGTGKLFHANIAAMAMFHLTERQKGKDSYYYHHLNSMPGTEEFPIFYNENEKANLKGSPFLTWLNEEIQD